MILSTPPKRPPSIAVLPFADMSPGGDQEYFCDGMAEELINALTQIQDLRVIARTPAFSFKCKNVDVREIGRQLNVGPGRVVKASGGSGFWRTIEMADKLPGTYVGPIFQDRDGYMWFGTDGGVTRYDGQMWTSFTTEDGLVDNRVKTIFQDRDGNLWFRTCHNI